MTRFKVGSAYFVVLGAITLVFGGLEFVTGLPGIGGVGNIRWLTIPADSWRGIILFFAGAFIALGAFDLRDIHGLGKTVLGSIMLWIVAGSSIFARVLGSIPGENAWFNSLEGFLATYGPPYSPALWLLPFSLVVLYFVVKTR